MFWIKPEAELIRGYTNITKEQTSAPIIASKILKSIAQFFSDQRLYAATALIRNKHINEIPIIDKGLFDSIPYKEILKL